MTECKQKVFPFTAHFSRRVEAGFTAGQVSNDGGALLLREVERRIKLLGRLAGCFRDGRDQDLVADPPCGRQSRASGQGREPALRRHLAHTAEMGRAGFI